MRLGRNKPENEAQPVERPTKLQRLEAQAERLTAEKAAIEAKLPELAERAMELRREHYRTGNPDQRSDAKGALSEVTRVAHDRRKLEDSLPALEAELVIVAEQLQVLRDEEAQSVFEQALAGLKEYDIRERELIDHLSQARAAFYEGYDELQALYAERRDYPHQFTLSDQGRVNQLQAAIRPVWDPAPTSAVEAFDRITIQTEKDEEPPVRLTYHLAEPHTDADLVAHFDRINLARQAGLSTQPLPMLPEHLGGPARPKAPEPVIVEPVDEIEEPDGPTRRDGTHDWRSRTEAAA